MLSQSLPAEVDPLADKVAVLAAKYEESAKPDDAGDKAAQPDYQALQRQESLKRAAMQLRSMERAIRQDDIESAKNLSRNLGNGEMVAGLAEFIDEINEAMEERIKESWETWYDEVRALGKDARDACLAANHSADLDAVLIRAAAMQMKRINQSNVLVQRSSDILTGITNSLKLWARYLDQHDAGNTNYANEILRTFSKSGADYPVLTVEEIQSKIVPDKPEDTFKSITTEILSGLNTPDDLPAVIERWKAFQNGPQSVKGDMSQVISMNAKLELLLKAFNELKAGNPEGAIAIANDRVFAYGNTEMNSALKPLITTVIDRALTAKVMTVLGPQSETTGNASKDFDRAVDTLKQKGDYEGILELLKIQGAVSGNFNPAISTIEHFLAAKRFESSNDLLMAVAEYRSVVAASPGPMVPQDEAGEALKRLQKDHPEMLKEYEGPLLEELRSLRLQMNQMRGGRYPGVRNY